MQRAGIKFECNTVAFSGRRWTLDTDFVFNSAQEMYRIYLNQTFPNNWREIYLKAQADGVKFVMESGTPLDWGFDEDASRCQLHAAQKETAEA